MNYLQIMAIIRNVTMSPWTWPGLKRRINSSPHLDLKEKLEAKSSSHLNAYSAILENARRSKLKEAEPQKVSGDLSLKAGKTKQEAELRGDKKLLSRIRGMDLLTCEAKYNRSCTKSYPKCSQLCICKIWEFVDNTVLNNKKMVKLCDLIKLFIAHLEETDFPNPEYRGRKLKDKLQNHPKYSSALS